MTGPMLGGRMKPAQPRRLHLVMRDATMIEGYIQITEEMTLVNFFNSRRGGWMNLTRARRPKLDEAPGHMIVQADHVILAMVPEQNVLIAGTAQGTEERPVEVVLVGGQTLRGQMNVAKQQRLSDFIAAAGKFVGLTGATLAADGRAVGDVALHGGAIQLIKDLRTAAPLDEGGSAPEPAAG
jgi:hypothetical protein